MAEFRDNKKSWTLAADGPKTANGRQLAEIIIFFICITDPPSPPPLSLGYSSSLEERPLILALSFICHCHTKGNCGR